MKILISKRVLALWMVDGGIVDLVTFVAVLMLLSYLSRELEIWRISNEIELHIKLFKASKDNATASVIRKFGELLSKFKSRINLSELESRVNLLIESVIIPVESLDPFGLVKKIKYLLSNVDKTLEDQIRKVVPEAEKSDIETLSSLIHLARELNIVYKAINHDYSLAKRFKSYWLLLQLEALLPFLAETVKAYEGALEALMRQIPIGDSVGPLVVTMLNTELRGERIELGVADTFAYAAEFEGRRLFFVKAQGPGSNTGRIDEALRRIVITWGSSIRLAVTIDAMVKFEGEISGSIAEGFGVAMGGTGAEKYEIEEVLSEYGMRTYAILIKMSAEEAMMPLSKELYDACVKAKERVKAVVLEHVPPGSAAIVVGVGNTIGIY